MNFTKNGVKFGNSNPTDKPSIVPGPGHYKVDIKTDPHFALGKSKKLVEISNNIPGPGTYKPIENTFDPKGFKFNKSDKKQN